MRFKDIIRRAGRSLKQAKIRTLLTSLAIAVGSLTLTFSLAAGAGARQYADTIIKSNVDPSQLLVAKDAAIFQGNPNETGPQEYDENAGQLNGQTVKRLTDTDIKKISKASGVESVAPQFTVKPQYITMSGKKKFTATINAYNPGQRPEVAAGSLPASGQLKNGTVLLPESYLKGFGFSDAFAAIGKQLEVQLQRSKPITQDDIQATLYNEGVEGLANLQPFESKAETLKVAAVLRQGSASFNAPTDLFVSDKDAVNFSDYVTEGTDNYHKYVAATAKVAGGGHDESKVEATKNAIKQQGYAAFSAKDLQAFLFKIVNVLQSIVAGFGILALIASVFGIVNTQYISVLERTQQIGLMKALGMRRRDVGRLFRFEAAWIGFLGGTIGALAAWLIGSALNPWISKTLNIGNENHLLIFQPLPIIGLIFGLMVLAIVAGILPARKAAKLDPVEALRTE